MPYYRKKTFNRRKPMFRRRGGKKTSTAPFSKRQLNLVKSMVTKSVNKTRELKQINVQVDEKKINIAGQDVVTTNLSNPAIFNHLSLGTQSYQRIGSQVQPVSLRMKGWAKVDAPSDTSDYYEFKSRIIFARIDNDNLQQLESSLMASPIFWNGQSKVPTGDYRDIIRSINYKFLQPIYDRTFTVAPNTTLYDSQGIPTTSTTSKHKATFNIVLNHKFGKNAELRWDNIQNDCYQKQNIVCICFNRLMNDDTSLTLLNLELCMEGNFYYLDA